MYTYENEYDYICIYIDTQMHVYKYIYTYTQMCINTHTHVHTYAQIYAKTHMSFAKKHPAPTPSTS